MRTLPCSLSIFHQAGVEVKQLPKVFVIHDNLAVLSSIEALLIAENYHVNCFPSAEAFLAQYHPIQVGCLVIDLSAPGVGGSELMRHLQETRSLLSIVIISGLIDLVVPHQHDGEPLPILAKPYEVWTLLTMISDATAGSLKRDRSLPHILSNQGDWLHDYTTNTPVKDKVSKLSPRQRQVLSFLLAGDTLKEVAQKLGLSEHTVGDYVKQIYKLFSVSSRAELLAQFISGEQP
jgi:FixJ family two-component response regulator